MRAQEGEFPQPTLARADDATNAAFGEGLNACATGEVQDAGNPPRQEVLDGQLVVVLATVQQTATPTLEAAYKTCLATKGTPANNLSDLHNKVGLKYPPVSFEQPWDPTLLDGRDEAVAFERRAAAADATCRAGAVDTALIAAQPALLLFLSQNAAKVASVEDGWAQAGADVPALRARAAQFQLRT
ncbi:hypothetical protein FHR83_008770 [Actinoplanes campanulatus]|uniref:Uncharacterized protein n=1 Tax=Actinoplanes campanulatus TaxID=113559 RepID=A0A7W5ARF2_9ACTN|nr:hypothetical protein [Actinoplanes campanulatus]MBB3101042.1 hypothetical protein [Actinoplanes campanulatus]GGN49360.1 hypothetical protein GCM10010109_87350 [Actinoplanes campanulatus]GID41866.1 hypothetical protein Aca09nite_83720 [Actinoplanes campanulatus]